MRATTFTTIKRIVVLCAVGALVATGVSFSGPAPAAARVAAEDRANEPTVDVPNLDSVPLRGWGVSEVDPDRTQTSSLDVLVWDFAQIGDRMFVGGAFQKTQRAKRSEQFDQPFVAAFDVRTGDWIDTWRPRLDRAVYSLEVLNNKLIVGGEFTQVNGQSREALVALDPITGAIDPTFMGSMERPYSDLRAMVRDLTVSGNQLYAVGNFSHANGANGTRTRVFKAARFIGPTGQIDTGWKPQVTGSGVWGADVDPSRNEVHLVGFFSAVNGEDDTGHFHTVDGTTGATVGGKKELPRNYPRSQPEMFDVVYGDDTVFVIGEQHIVQVLDADTHEMLAYNHTGLREDMFEHDGGFAGGAFQVGERIGDYVFSGCHCTYSTRNGIDSHYSSVNDVRTNHRLAMAYDVETGAIYEPFNPDINSPQDGAWAIKASSNGCVWLGGDFHLGGLDAGSPHWLGGFGRFCDADFDPDVIPEPEPDANTLVDAGSTWSYNDSGADLGTNWVNPGYNANGWATGATEIGFGERDLGTTVTKGHITYYMRTQFQHNGSNPQSLTLNLRADDGAIVYLNGTEVVRDNIPNGPVTSQTPAAGWKAGEDEDFVEYTIGTDALRAGTNTLAVEVHNVWRSNNDLRFDLSLDKSQDAPPVEVGGPFITAGSDWKYLDNASSTPNGWPANLAAPKTGAAPLGFGEDNLGTTLPRGNEAYYFTRTFQVNDAAAVDQLELSLMSDDGAAVYINGTIVKRSNMPAGTLSWSTRPLTWASGADELFKTSTISPQSLVNGTNTITVEVHNYWPGNNDLNFDLELSQ